MTAPDTSQVERGIPPAPWRSEMSNVKSQIVSGASANFKLAALGTLFFFSAFSAFSVAENHSGSKSPLCPSRPSVENPSVSRSHAPTFFLSELPSPTSSALGSWLLSAAGALSILALAKQFMRKTPIEAEFLTKKEFNEFRDKVDTSFNLLRDRIDHSHEALATKLDNINTRLADVTSLVARLDERTKSNPPRSADCQSAVSQAASLHPPI